MLIYAVVSITTTTCSITSTITATSAATADIAVAGIAAVGCTTTTTATTTMSSTIEQHAASYYSTHPIYPSADSRLDAMPKSSYASPFSSCEYQNKACFGTL